MHEYQGKHSGQPPIRLTAVAEISARLRRVLDRRTLKATVFELVTVCGFPSK